MSNFVSLHECLKDKMQVSQTFTNMPRIVAISELPRLVLASVAVQAILTLI